MEEGSKPNHIAIIPDGNRRWAKKNNVSLEEAYEKGIKKIAEVAKWCKEKDIHYLTMWGFSTENFRRNREEIEKLFSLFRKYLFEGLRKMEKEEQEEKKKVRVKFFGRLHLLPAEIQELIKEVERRTANNKPYQLNLLLAYGGRGEIVDAVNKILKDGIKEVDEKIFENYLYTAGIPDPDLVIRTSGEKRLSGLMPWQTVYSEFYFTDVLWPDFSKEDFEKALEDYARRKRKFGR